MSWRRRARGRGSGQVSLLTERGRIYTFVGRHIDVQTRGRGRTFKLRRYPRPSRGGSSIEPDVFHPVAVVDAVDHRRQPFDVRLRAGPAARVEDDRSGALLGQTPFIFYPRG